MAPFAQLYSMVAVMLFHTSRNMITQPNLVRAVFSSLSLAENAGFLRMLGKHRQRRGLRHRFGKVIRLSLLNSKKNWRENLLIRRDDLYKGNIKNVLYGE